MSSFVSPSLLPNRLVALPTDVSTTCYMRRRQFARSSLKTPPENEHIRRRIRVPRNQTHHHPDWQWRGTSTKASTTHASTPSSADISAWTSITFYKVFNAIHKSGQTLSQNTGPFFNRITALGVRVLKSFTDAIGRALRGEVDYADLTVEYGIAEPCPNDKTFVDPLKEWDLSCSRDSFYRDSSGKAVYLQLHGPSGLVASTDFRDVLHDCYDRESLANSSEQHQRTSPSLDTDTDGNDSPEQTPPSIPDSTGAF